MKNKAKKIKENHPMRFTRITEIIMNHIVIPISNMLLLPLYCSNKYHDDMAVFFCKYINLF